jgi:hypothetical protein
MSEVNSSSISGSSSSSSSSGSYSSSSSSSSSSCSSTDDGDIRLGAKQLEQLLSAKQKHTCPYCKKELVYLKAHIRNNHPDQAKSGPREEQVSGKRKTDPVLGNVTIHQYWTVR